MSHTLLHILLAVLLLVSLIFLSTIGVLSYVLDWGRLGTNFVVQPLIGPFTKLKNIIVFSLNLKDLAVRNEILTKQVQELMAESASLEKAKQENRYLREALGFYSEKTLNLIPAEVIGWDALNPEPVLTLNRGTGDGVEKGRAVLIASGILVGVVTAVTDQSSQIEILTSSAVAVNAEGVESGVRGVVNGAHGLGLTFNLISHDEKLVKGERVVTSGLGGQYPKSLLIGDVGEIRSQESELFQEANIIPAANFRNLRLVFIVRNE